MVEFARAPSPLRAATHDGVALTPEPLLAVLKVRLHADQDAAPVTAALGVAPPAVGRQVAVGEAAVAGLAPNEWLVTGAAAAIAGLHAALDGGLAGRAALIVDLTHARASIKAAGGGARDLVAAHCPLDLSDHAFPVGAAARSLFGDAGLFIARLDDADGAPCFRLIVDQAAAPYVARLLDRTAVAP